MSKRKFKTEVSQLLHLIIHSLYSHKEIFLRELISNASDALDKLKYLTLTQDEFKSMEIEPRIDIRFDDENKKWLEISDTGIGMDEKDLGDQLGTIARSGTKNFLNLLSGDDKKDSNLIGQFGVGFYSAFMVADSVTVVTKKAGTDSAYSWKSDGKGSYEIAEAERDGIGTTITLELNAEGNDFTSRWQIEDVVKKYSDHIAFPIYLHYDSKTYEGEGDDRTEKTERKVDQVNSASALWQKSKSDLKDEDYNEFYKTISHDTEEPLLYVHTKAEGTQEYTTLFFIPKKAPFDIFQADYRSGLKLYVKRVFITDDDKELMPVYLRFLRGIIDSEDLPLNVSREILQKNRVLAAIKSASVKKILSELKALSENNASGYEAFIEQYNRLLKEGMYSDYANRDELQDLVRFKSTEVEGWTSFKAYTERMKEDQKGIYYITGEDEDTLKASPLLEAYRAKGIEVLIMADEVDEIVIPSLGKYGDHDLKAANRSGTDDDLKTEGDEEKEKELKPFLKKVKKVLGERVKDVVASSRLSDSPSCIVADENDPSLQMRQMMRSMGQEAMDDFKPILEINPTHDIVEKVKASEDNKMIEDVSFLLLEQALLVEGAELEKPAEFVKRLNRIMAQAL